MEQLRLPQGLDGDAVIAIALVVQEHIGSFFIRPADVDLAGSGDLAAGGRTEYRPGYS